MQIGREGDSLGACVEHDAAYPVFADGARQSLQSANVIASQGCGSFHFNAPPLDDLVPRAKQDVCAQKDFRFNEMKFGDGKMGTVNGWPRMDPVIYKPRGKGAIRGNGPHWQF